MFGVVTVLTTEGYGSRVIRVRELARRSFAASGKERETGVDQVPR